MSRETSLAPWEQHIKKWTVAQDFCTANTDNHSIDFKLIPYMHHPGSANIHYIH